MTFKKSMISIAAAGVIAAGLTGCGSSDSTTAGGGGGTPTSLTAVDGYVKNANAAAILVSGTPVELDFVENSHVYSLPSDLNTSNYAGLQLTYRGKTGTTAATYFENDGVTGFSAAGGDVQAPAAFEMFAPKGFSVVTPLSTLVYSLIDSTETNATKLDNEITAKLGEIATSLGLSTTELQSTDPLSSSNGAYALMNALVGQTLTDAGTLTDVGNIATALVARPAAADAAAAFANLAVADTANTDMYTSTANAITADPTILDRVSTMNLDQVRDVAKAGTFIEISNTVVSKDFNVTGITIGSTNVRDLAAPGAKILPSDLNNTAITISAKDVNGSAKANLDLIIVLGNEAANVGTAVSSGEIAIKINLDLNTTTLNGDDLNGTVSNTVKIDYVDANGTTSSKDYNSTAIDLNITDLVKINEHNITVQTAAILDRIDANLSTSSSSIGLGLDQVASVQMVLVDNNSSLATTTVVGDKTYPTSRVESTATSYYGTVTGTGLTILDLDSKSATEKKLADMRATETEANAKPDHTLSLTTTSADGNGTEAAPYVLVANSDDTNYTMTLGASSTDTTEGNSSAVFTFTGNALLSTYADDENITTALAATTAATATTGNIELNATALNAVTTPGKITGSVSVVVTDEFLLTGDANNTLYFTVNRAPYDVNESNITDVAPLSVPFASDTNLTGESNNTDINTTSYITIMDYDGNDFNSSTSGFTFNDVNVSTLDRNTSDFNVSLESNMIRFMATDGSSEVNASFVYTEDNKFIVNFETNDTTINNLNFEGNVTISDYNLTDKYGSMRNITDSNITLFFDLNGSL